MLQLPMPEQLHVMHILQFSYENCLYVEFLLQCTLLVLQSEQAPFEWLQSITSLLIETWIGKCLSKFDAFVSELCSILP